VVQQRFSQPLVPRLAPQVEPEEHPGDQPQQAAQAHPATHQEVLQVQPLTALAWNLKAWWALLQGHPDSICDAIAEEVSLALCREYLATFGRILHRGCQ
jgi:hypothetical protein